MKIEIINIEQLKEYENNPRFNDESALLVAESIKEFGFQQPIVIDKNNIVIAGHTRLKASKMLGLKTVPCKRAEHLTDEQVKAYRLADNKVAEASKWNIEELKQELNQIESLDMDLFGFEKLNEELEELEDLDDLENEGSEDVEDDGYYGDERENTFNAYNLYEYNPFEVEGKYNMPKIYKTDFEPSNLVGFNYVLSTKEKDGESTIHFYLDDYQFERIWNRPHFYIDKIAENYDSVLTPDFSLYLDMPIAMKIWNTYRSRLIGQLMQQKGLEVIPTISWAEKETFEFCFDGIEKGGTVSVSTIGVKRDEESYNVWVAGMDEMIKRLEPKCIVVYGGELEDYKFKNNIKIINMENKAFKRGE